MITGAVALWVDPGGPYPGRCAEWYDEQRDAMNYRGMLPVVAHPPCGAWSKLRHLRNSNADARMALRAIDLVRALGGVLEHPAESKLWDACCLPDPDQPPDAYGGFALEIAQSDWGHVARKRTWLYVCGCGREQALGILHPPYPGRAPTHWCSGSRKAPRGPVPPGIKVCSAEQRRRTPPLLADALLLLACACGR